MKREPHGRRVYLPPEEPEQESLAMALIGLAGIVLAAIFVFVLLPVLVL